MSTLQNEQEVSNMTLANEQLPERTQWLDPDGLILNREKHLIDFEDRDADVEASVRSAEREQMSFEKMHQHISEQLPSYCKDISIKHEISFEVLSGETRLRHVWYVFCTIAGLRYCKSEGTIYLAVLTLKREVEKFAEQIAQGLSA